MNAGNEEHSRAVPLSVASGKDLLITSLARGPFEVWSRAIRVALAPAACTVSLPVPFLWAAGLQAVNHIDADRLNVRYHCR